MEINYVKIEIISFYHILTLGEPKRREMATLSIYAEKRRGNLVNNLPLGVSQHKR